MGFAHFLGAKLAGYTAFCHWVISPSLQKAGRQPESAGSELRLGLLSDIQPAALIQNSIPSSVKAGVIRTLIGVVVGAVVGFGFWAIPYFSTHDTAGSVLFFTFLVPVRVGEWALLLWWIYHLRAF